MSDLNDLFKVVAEGKKHFEDTTLVGQKVKQTKVHVKEDLGSLFAQLAALKEDIVTIDNNVRTDEDIINEISTLVAEETLTEEVPLPIIKTPQQRIDDTQKTVDRYLTGKTFQQPDPDPVAKNMEAIQTKMKFLEQAIGRIAAAGPGSGEVNLRWLDDIDRPTIYDMRFLRYNNTTKKFEFAEVNPHDVVYTTFLVTTPTYNVNSDDYYIGVNYAGPTTITLPTTLLSSGRTVIIKDESGNAETNPITVIGNVDNDPDGFIIQINNGAVQLIYRNGWRIV